MKINMVILWAVVSMAGLAACSKNAPPADGLPGAAPNAVAAPTSTTPAAPAAAAVNPLADFSVEPGVVYACEGRDRTVALVKWHVKDPAVTRVKVEIDSATDPSRQTFTVGATSGEARTEEWVGAGVRFHLSDFTSGKELATYEVTSLPCE